MPCYNYQCYFSGQSLVALVPEILSFSEARSINSDRWSSMSGFKEERIDGCFFRATYSVKGGACDLIAHYSLLVRRNDRVESPMQLCTIIWCMAHGPGCWRGFWQCYQASSICLHNWCTIHIISSDMKLYNGVSFQLLFRVSCHRCSFRNKIKLTSLLIRANIYITTEDKVVRRC